MKPSILKNFLYNREAWAHIVIWTLFFLTINVEWTQSWVKLDFLPYSVAPHVALSIPIIFFSNVFWLMPRYLNRKKWITYFTVSFTLLIGFEVLRSFLFSELLSEVSFRNELLGNNSLLFGKLNVLVFTIIFYSFVYKLGRDWFIHQRVIHKLKEELKASHLKSNNEEVECVKKKATFSVKKRDGVILLKVEQVIYFKAQGDFVLAIDRNSRKHIINDSLRNIVSQLSEKEFFQINRGEIVNFNYIEKYDAYIKNRLGIKILNSAETLYTSNSRTPSFRTWIESH